MTHWSAINGRWTFGDEEVVFHGEPTTYPTTSGDQLGLAVGLAMSDQRFGGGDISGTAILDGVSDDNSCELVFYFDPGRQWFVSAGIGGPGKQFVIRHWDGKWTVHAVAGDRKNLEARRPYHLRVAIRGSVVTLSCDGVAVCSATLPFQLPTSQVGISSLSDHAIRVRDFVVASAVPTVFVVTQFSSPYDEIYRHVIKAVCGDFGFDARRADDTYGPGLIIADIARQILEAKFVIAEVTPPNPNVYYEVGFAHAANKPTILLADKGSAKLPFDVSPFRTLFYENTIGGKVAFEEGLKRHIEAILRQGLSI